MTAILQAIGNWLLRIFLGGLFNKVMSQIEEEAKQKEKAAQLHAQSTSDAMATEIAIAKAQSEVKDKYRDAAAKPANPVDPFGNDEWNKGT